MDGLGLEPIHRNTRIFVSTFMAQFNRESCLWFDKRVQDQMDMG